MCSQVCEGRDEGAQESNNRSFIGHACRRGLSLSLFSHLGHLDGQLNPKQPQHGSLCCVMCDVMWEVCVRAMLLCAGTEAKGV